MQAKQCYKILYPFSHRKLSYFKITRASVLFFWKIYESEKFFYFCFHHIFESENFRFPVSTENRRIGRNGSRESLQTAVQPFLDEEELAKYSCAR